MDPMDVQFQTLDPKSSFFSWDGGPYRCFQKYGYPQIIHSKTGFSIINHSSWGPYPYFWKHPYTPYINVGIYWVSIPFCWFPHLSLPIHGTFNTSGGVCMRSSLLSTRSAPGAYGVLGSPKKVAKRFRKRNGTPVNCRET